MLIAVGERCANGICATKVNDQRALCRPLRETKESPADLC